LSRIGQKVVGPALGGIVDKLKKEQNLIQIGFTSGSPTMKNLELLATSMPMKF
jgi:hypothetical protein